MKKKEKEIKDRILSDQTAYEEKLFKVKRMSNMQKHLNSLHKTNQFEQIKRNVLHHHCKRTIPEDYSAY